DVAGVLAALAIEKAVFIGHDWGGAVSWQMGRRLPERVARLIGLTTPYGPLGGAAATSNSLPDLPGPARQPVHTPYLQPTADAPCYMLYYPTHPAHQYFEADVRTNLKKIFMDHSRCEDFTTFMKVGGDGSGAFANISRQDTFLTDEELDVYAREFERTGIRG